MSVTSWFLVSSSGTRHRLPREMIFVGREECELMLQSRSVDKQHAVINYDPNKDEHMVKDLGSLNGTFVNDLRIPDQEYIYLKLSDVIRFGYDVHVYILEKSQHKVPKEVLDYKSQSSAKSMEANSTEKQQLQSSEKSKDPVSNVKLQEKAERKAQLLTAPTDSPKSKPTPLYGQPSWWGEDEEQDSTKQNRGGKMPEDDTSEPAKDVPRYEVHRSQSDTQVKSTFSYHREPSYFEIPTKEFQQKPAKSPDSHVHEVPTKDTSDSTQFIPSTSTPPVVQSHASFTIEFDECTPGKLKIKDHVTKFAFRQQHKQTSPETPSTPTEVLSAESKVADWLVQSNASMIRRTSQGENIYSTNSHSSDLKIRNANYNENGSYSEPGHSVYNANQPPQSKLQDVLHGSPKTSVTSPSSESSSPPESQSLSSHSKAEPNQAFVIEFFDDNSRKKHSQSFTHTATPPESPHLRVQQDKKSSSPNTERHVSSSSSITPPTQRYTIPLKGPDTSGFQRAGSLRREKTEDRLSTSFSSRSSSSVTVKPFSSVGRRSKITKEFNAELLKQKEKFSSSRERNASNSPKAAQRRTAAVTQSEQRQSSPPPPVGHLHPQTSSPIHPPAPLKTTFIPTQTVEVRSPRNEEDDSLSDAGTYTIEADIQDKELEEARSKIDQVFGVESPEQMKQTEAEASSAFRTVIDQGREEYRRSSCDEGFPAPEQGQGLKGVKVQPAGALVQGAPKWMSCWASLADSYTESGPSSGLFDMPSQMEPSGGARGTIIHKNAVSQDNLDAESSRARRILQSVPHRDNSDILTPSIHVHYNPNMTFDIEDTTSVAPKPDDGVHRLTVQDDVEPDSLSDASKSDDGSIIEQSRRQLSEAEEKQNEDNSRLPFKSTSFYIGSEEESKPQHGVFKISTPKAERKSVSSIFSSATLTKQKGIQSSGIKVTASAPILNQRTDSPEGKEAAAPSLIRQESFTKERPSNARLPNISSLPVQRDPDSGFLQGNSSQDTQSYLKQTEDVLAVLEAKFQATPLVTTPSPIMDSLSGDSDVDTSSTVSQHSNKTKPHTLIKKTYAGIPHRDRRTTDTINQGVNNQTEKLHSCGSNGGNKAEPFRRHVGLRRSVGKSGSTDLSDDPQSLPYSDQENGSNQTHRKYTLPLQKEDGKSSRVSQMLSRANSLSAPRPTRASMLRRARLGESSDNEGTETDRLAQEVNSPAAKQPQEAKKPSRLDMLAMPRKRTGSFNTPSDTEASSTPQWTGKSTSFSSRSIDPSSSSNQRISTPGTKPVERPQKSALNKMPFSRSRSGSAKYTSSTASSRRRHKGSDYTSTSDEEYESNWSNLKHKRSQPSPASHTPHSQARPQPVVAQHPKPRSRNSDEENREGEAFHNWSTHSAEIARLSQDLAKDLAILAREIHDVAGDGDPQTPVAENSEQVPYVSEPEVNHRVPQSPAPKRDSDPRSGDQSSRHSAQNRKEANVEGFILNPMYQVTAAIRENTEQLAEKIKVLFQDKLDIWEDIEARINSDSDVTVGKLSGKEMASILKELRRVQVQLEVINAAMDPSGTCGATKTSPPAAASSSSSEVQPSRTSSSRDWRTVHSVSKRGGGPRPSESVRRAAVTPDDVREGYLV
ncbi:centrosomal protein of 170 kDa protein B isoform X2 [Girardinichthys multiradiatus]|uniref:centrosomal protein of 170 kDa protein B isoform X2 n=1 Tax=Girardinichthys multiradiatus TaxID=208333 RepID=UPI001FADB3F4|nr:centrosomal protein of 170 kDa protein B isoform X2 [Girardinichthys multiradiatus]